MAEERYHAVGRRKAAVARIWMKPGNGVVTVNKKPIDDYLTREGDRLLIRKPLELTDCNGALDQALDNLRTISMVVHFVRLLFRVTENPA